MRYFLDTEFLDDPTGTDLISLGLVANDGREFYAISADYDRARVAASPWLVEHVVPHLEAPGAPAPVSLRQMAADLETFCTSCDDGRPAEVWAWNGTYDFYLLSKLYGRMIDIPQVVPRRFFDLKQWARHLGNVTVPEQAAGVHHALADARHDRATWTWLAEYERVRGAKRDERVRARLMQAITGAAKSLSLG